MRRSECRSQQDLGSKNVASLHFWWSTNSRVREGGQYTGNKNPMLFCPLVKSHILGVPPRRTDSVTWVLDFILDGTGQFLRMLSYFLQLTSFWAYLSCPQQNGLIELECRPSLSSHPFSLTPHLWLTFYFLAAVNKIPTTTVLSVVAQQCSFAFLAMALKPLEMVFTR